MTARPWMPLYVADYLADTGHLSAAEHGAYLLLIMHYWVNGGLPAEDRKLARIARMSEREWLRSRDTIADFFGDGWTHARIDAELAKVVEISGKRRAAAEQRHNKRSANADANAGQKDTHSHSHSQATAAKAAAAGPPPLDVEDFRMRCIKAAGDDWRAGFGKIRALAEAGVSIEDRILPVIRTVAAELRQQRKTVTSWGWFAQAITDEDRRAEPAESTAETVWCPISSPEFAAGNRARARRGEAPYRGIPSRHQAGEKGAYHLKSDLAEGAT